MLRFLLLSEYWKTLIYMIPAILISISAHEFAHGYMSYRLGDSTPKREGRLTLNPFAHIDVTGAICFLVFGIGWAKPVNVTPYYYKNRKKGIIAVALAGVCMNFILAFLSLLLYGVFLKTNKEFCAWFYYMAVLNIKFGTFNLIPIPPLDGSKVMEELFSGMRKFYYQIEPYSMWILIALLSTGGLGEFINIIENHVLNKMWETICNILNFLTFGGSAIYL